MVTSIEDILFSELEGQDGHVGVITLNRPQSLNALTRDMCVAMREQLVSWENDKLIKCVVVRGAGDKAFCAGGDIRHIYDLGKMQQYEIAERFFWDEYRNNFTIAQYTKPYIAFLDGITMGGGVGISIHAKHRVVTEKTLFAMPETGIGFFPDVGGSYFLSRCAGEYGTYLALTGARLDASCLIDAQLADYLVTSNHLDDLLQTLANTSLGSNAQEVTTEIINEFNVPVEPSSELRTHRAIIEECFSFDTVEEIFQALKEHNSDWSNEVLKVLESKSPTSLKVTLQQVRRGVSFDLAGCLKMEYRLCQHFLRGHDFYEGIRAALVEKDKNPQWRPIHLEEIEEEAIDHYFTLMEEQDLALA